MTSELAAVFFGLASAASWGSGDFSGGLAARRTVVYTVVVGSQIVGLLCLLALAFLLDEQMPSPSDMALGAVAGISGGVALAAFYTGLARGPMGVVAPVAALMTAAVPVIVGFTVEGLPAGRQIAGLGLALVAVWFMSRSGSAEAVQLGDLRLPLIAGLGFGIFLTILGRLSDEAILWPLAASRVASIAMLSLTAILLHQVAAPAAGQIPLIALAGLLDTAGTASFSLAARLGRLDIAAVLASLYPAATVLLAWFILKERLSFGQWLGIVAALAAVILIAA